MVMADEEKIEEVLNNFIDNDLKFSPEGSKVIISAKPERNSVIVSVRDFGVGIPEKSKPHIFEKFYEADMSFARKTGGTGLGLYISKKMVEQMNGRTWFASTYGKGSTFSFSLPTTQKKRAL